MIIDLNEKELQTIANSLALDIMAEAKLYNDTEIYKETQMYKTKAKMYTKIQSKIFGYEVEIDENSIFGILDLKGVE